MFCPHCGTANDDNAFRCLKCRQIIQVVPQPVIVSDGSDSAVMRWLVPVGRSGWAIAAGYAGLFALAVLPAPVALILGIVAIVDLRKRPHKYGMGRAVFGVVMGALGTGLLIWVGVALSGD